MMSKLSLVINNRLDIIAIMIANIMLRFNSFLRKGRGQVLFVVRKSKLLYRRLCCKILLFFDMIRRSIINFGYGIIHSIYHIASEILIIYNSMVDHTFRSLKSVYGFLILLSNFIYHTYLNIRLIRAYIKFFFFPDIFIGLSESLYQFAVFIKHQFIHQYNLEIQPSTSSKTLHLQVRKGFLHAFVMVVIGVVLYSSSIGLLNGKLNYYISTNVSSITNIKAVNYQQEKYIQDMYAKLDVMNEKLVELHSLEEKVKSLSGYEGDTRKNN